MKYKPTAKFKTLNKLNAHQGLSREEFNKFMAGEAVEILIKHMPPRLVEEGYVEKVEATNGN